MSTADVHSCFRCELRFASRPELEDHLRREHDFGTAPVDSRGRTNEPLTGSISLALDPTVYDSNVTALVGALAAQAHMGVEVTIVNEPGLAGYTLDAFARRAEIDLRNAGAPSVRTNRLPLEAGEGVPGALIRHLETSAPTFACMTTRSRSGPAELVLGSVSAEVLRHSSVPLLLLGRRVERLDKLDRIVVALDGSDLAARSLGPALDMAERFGATVRLVEVLPGEVPAVASVETEKLRNLASQLSGGSAVGFDVVVGEAADALMEYCDGPGTMLVMSTHGRSAVERILMGGVATDVLRAARFPVLVVPPAASVRMVDLPATED